MAAAQSGSKLSQLIKRGWTEIPDIMAGTLLAITGIAIGSYGLYQNSQKLVERPFKINYIVMRDDDPKAEPYKKFHEKPVY